MVYFSKSDNQFVGVIAKDDIAFGLETIMPREEMIKNCPLRKNRQQEDYLEANPENLSGGQKQRVAIAGVGDGNGNHYL